jgi:mannose-6-phosphate isomerase-like protein (cupin superfamily)
MSSDGSISKQQQWHERLAKRRHCPDWHITFESADCLIEYWEPKGPDTQQPHNRDEIYMIVAGGADFDLNGDIRSVVAGDLIFVLAGTPHRFTSWSTDLALWIVFYGANRRVTKDDSSEVLSQATTPTPAPLIQICQFAGAIYPVGYCRLKSIAVPGQ